MNATAARPPTSQSAHYYTPEGIPCHTVKCTTKEGERPTNVSDAKRLGLLPSPTTILKVLHREALVQWRTEQAILACLTAPKRDDEAIDAFVERIIHTDREHEQEARAAADMGTRIHAALQAELSGGIAEHEMLPYIEPVWEWLNGLPGCDGGLCEAVLVGDGYAGRTDFIHYLQTEERLWDFKSKDTLPKKAYLEDRLQLAAYAKARSTITMRRVSTGNIYISRTEPGKFCVCVHDDWQRDYEAFRHLLEYWRIVNQFPS